MGDFRMRRLKTATAVVLSLSLSGAAQAASLCTTPKEMAALRAAAIQQQLMVAGLTCQADQDYNRFVLAYRPELQRSDAELKDYFVRRHGRRAGEAAYDSFKTKLANLSSFSEVTNGASYCANARAAFDAVGRESLDRFVASQPLLIALPEQTLCKAGPNKLAEK
jgi:phosphate-selective porin